MAAVAPQKRQCELGSYYPAASAVKPPPRKAAGTLHAGIVLSPLILILRLEVPLSVIRTTNGQIPHKRLLEVTPPLPGIGKQTAIYLIIATKGFEAFENWRQLACYAGVAPFPYQSGTSIFRQNKVHPFADKKLKTLLNMCAICAVRHDKELKTYYERKVAEGKAKMLVINNVRCKLLARVFAVINRKSTFINTYKFAS